LTRRQKVIVVEHKRHKPLTRFYDELCEHYRMRPTRNNTGIAHENGSIESPAIEKYQKVKQVEQEDGLSTGHIDRRIAELQNQMQNSSEP
jgi:hypothetical protein